MPGILCLLFCLILVFKFVKSKGKSLVQKEACRDITVVAES